MMCNDESQIFKRDEEAQRPQLEKWGIPQNAKPLEIPAIQSGIRPKIGMSITDSQLEYLKDVLPKINDLFASQLQRLDDTLVKSFRFFSIVDKKVRYTMYDQIQLMHWPKAGTLIEEDAEESEYVYITIKGKVNYMMFKFDTKVTLTIATYRAGEVFGDGSIQRQFFDVLKILSKDRKYLETDHDDVYALRIPKQHFVEAIFAEMSQELMYKIILFRKTPYFKELSPYSLIMFASICQVKECRYGEVISEQGTKPDSCYILAYGRCKSVYKYPEIQSTQLSKYAKKTLRNDQRPKIKTGMTNYKTLPSEQRRRQPGEEAEQNQPYQQKYNKQRRQQGDDGFGPYTSNQQQSTAGRPLSPNSILGEGNEIPEIKLRRACNKKEIEIDERHHTLKYEHHIDFQDIKEGDVICSRVLLDNQTFKKYISMNSLRFSDQVGFSYDDMATEHKQLIAKKESDANKRSKLIAEAMRRQNEFCKICFEQRKPQCDCLLNQLSPSEKQLVKSQQALNQQLDPLAKVIHQSIDQEQSLDDSGNALQLNQLQNQNNNPPDSAGFNDLQSKKTLGSRNGQQPNLESVSAAIGMFNTTQNGQSPPSAFAAAGQNTATNDLASVLLNQKQKTNNALSSQPGTERSMTQKSNTLGQQTRKLMTTGSIKTGNTKLLDKQRDQSPLQTEMQKEEEINGLLIDRLHDNLVRSQTSIIVTTAIAKLIQIRKEDKSFLNEALKQSVDKVILDQNFNDFDRPLCNFDAVQKVVAEERGWLKQKAKMQEETLFMAKFSKRANPLLDD